MSGRSRSIVLSVTVTCVLGAILLVARSLGGRARELVEATPGIESVDARPARTPEALVAPRPSERESSDVADSAPPAGSHESRISPAVAPPLAAEREESLRSLVEMEEFAAKLPDRGFADVAKSSAELGFLQACVGHVLARANRGVDASVGDELRTIEIAADEYMFFHEGKRFVVRRGEFPVYDEARDRVAAERFPPRSPEYYDEYLALFERARSALGERAPR